MLLDTHALLWWLEGNARLSAKARRAIADGDNVILVSAATAWEIATKARIGKLPDAIPLARDLVRAVLDQGFESLPITLAHAQRAGLLPGPHRDPFDRMLIAQALAEDVPLVSNEKSFDAYGITRIW